MDPNIPNTPPPPQPPQAPPAPAFPESDSPPSPVAPAPMSPVQQPQAPVAPTQPTPPPTTVATPITVKRGGGGKIFIILLLILLILGGLAAVIIPRMSNLSGPVTLTWWGLWEDQSIINPLIAEYQQTHPNVTITYLSQAKEDYRERLTSSLAKGEGPDIFRFHNTWAPMFQSTLDMMPASVMSASDYATTFYPVVASDMAKESSFVGIPLGFDSIALFINEEIFNLAGKQAPTTWDDLRTIARELTIKDENGSIKQAGAALGRTENVDHWPEIVALLMLQNGAKLSSPTGELAENAVDFYTRFSKQDGVWDTTLPASTVAFAGVRLAE